MSGAWWIAAALLAAGEGATPRPEAKATAPHVAEDGSRSGRVHLQLDSDATWGVGAQMFLGGQLRLAALLEQWTTSAAIGTWDLGGAFAYQNEPRFLAPWLDPAEITGAGHRVQILAHLGHTVHFGRRRRVALGLHGYAGVNHWRSVYAVDYASEGVSGRATVARTHALVGGELRVAYRFHRRVGVNFILGAPAPTASSYAITLLHVGLGLAFYLR